VRAFYESTVLGTVGRLDVYAQGPTLPALLNLIACSAKQKLTSRTRAMPDGLYKLSTSHRGRQAMIPSALDLGIIRSL
jgi:hypothetical protein